MFDNNSKAIDILTSRDSIRSQLIDYAKDYLELENVDLTYTSFLSYIINVLSQLTANQLYYTSSIYREFFITEAQMEESVYNLAKWVGYTPETALPATVDVLLTLPLKFKDTDVTFIIPNGFKITSQDIVYTSDLPMTVQIEQDLVNVEYEDMINEGIAIRVIDNKAVTARNPEGYFYPVLLNSDAETASVLVPFTQYEIQEFTYVVDPDLEIYQFWSVALEFEGMPWRVNVYEGIKQGNTIIYDLLEQAEGNSLYTMSSYDKKYVFTSTYNKADIFFGNGVIGKQPTIGSTIKVELFLTKGEGGRVITGALTKPDKLYYTYYDTTTGKDKTLPIKLITNNPSPATGGDDAPSITAIKSRAIANLRSKGRFVSDSDYDDMIDIIPDTPLSDAKPILKRSDIKTNEIMVFSKLKYQDQICPTRNTIWPLDSTSSLDIIDPGSTIEIDGEDYELIFAMDPDLNTLGIDYSYLVNEINITPVIEQITGYAQYSYIIITNCNFVRDGNAIELTADITNIDDRLYDFECALTTLWDGLTYNMVSQLDGGGDLNSFFYDFSHYSSIPLNQQKFKFRITGMVPHELISGAIVDERKTVAVYSCDAIIRKDLSEFMMSSITEDSTAGYVIHNVPVIRSQWFTDEDVDRALFELLAIQALIGDIDINSKRMLTDFINIKFSDTTGTLDNMMYNEASQGNVTSRTQTTIPLSPAIGEQWIVNGTEDVTWVEHRWDITRWSATGWEFLTPSKNSSAHIVDEDLDIVYTGCRWILPEFGIPFTIQAVVSKDYASPISSSALIENIKDSLLETFTPKFAMDANIDRSEIITVIRTVPGVTYCELNEPAIDIKFTYNMEDLPMIQLLDYTPQLVAFTYDNISISIREVDKD
jgi:hypothetical protein